jgi:hypothetical protein
MPLADDIRALRDRTSADLTAAHDYYTDTKLAWDIVRRFVDGGKSFSSQSTTTGTVTTQSDLVGKSHAYVAGHLTEATFLQFISIFENFFFDLVRLWLTAYPKNLSGKKVDFEDVLAAPDKDAITAQVVGRELNEFLYKRPAGWFDYLEEKAKLGCPTRDEVAEVAERKASRDVLVHNRGVASKTYESKAGSLARYSDGQRIDIPEQYHRKTWELLRKVVADVSDAAAAKVA